MATRGTIAIQNADGSINVVYSHWDNYIEGAGRLLLEYYNNKEAVENLIANGDISALGSYVSSTPKPFDRTGEKDWYTIFYTYRGEQLRVNHWSSIEDYERNQQFEEYNYLFCDGVWSVNSGNDWEDLEFLLQDKA